MLSLSRTAVKKGIKEMSNKVSINLSIVSSNLRRREIQARKRDAMQFALLHTKNVIKIKEPREFTTSHHRHLV